MKEFENRITAKSRKSALKTAIPCLALSVCFFALAVWMFVTGCSNILQINDLNKNGVAVQITVTNVRIDSSRENTAYYYTFSYNVDSKTYEFVDSSDRDYEVGDTFTARIDPDHPQNLVLPNNNLFFAFLMLLFSGGLLFISERFRFLSKYIPHALVVWAAVMIITGVLLPNTTACVLGVVFLIATLAVRVVVYRKKKRQSGKRCIQSLTDEMPEQLLPMDTTEANRDASATENSRKMIPAKYFSVLFLFREKPNGFRKAGIDRRNGDLWSVQLMKENQCYKGKKISWEALRSSIPAAESGKLPELGPDNWKQYGLFWPENTYLLHESAQEVLGSGMRMGTVRTAVTLAVEKNGYRFLPEAVEVPFGFFANQTFEETESFLHAVIAHTCGISEPPCDMYELVYKLKDSDAFLAKSSASSGSEHPKA